MVSLNVFRLAGDMCHLSSKIILIATIHMLRSSEGVSLSTQFIYLVVFITRYLDIIWQYHTQSTYLTTMKAIYIGSAVYTLYLMTHRYPPANKETRWGLVSWRVGSLFGFSLVSAIVMNRIFSSGYDFEFGELIWDFSQPLESVAIIPQLSLLTNLQIPSVITTYYLVPLGLYRALYILNWIYRYFVNGWWDPMSVVFGILQTALYAEFFWIYWRRQKIRLREGDGELDEEDLRKGWFLGRILGFSRKKGGYRDVEGGRGQSVRADDGVLPPERFADDDEEDSSEEEEEDHIPAESPVDPRH